MELKNFFTALIIFVIGVVIGMVVDRYVIGIDCVTVGEDSTQVAIPLLEDTTKVEPIFVVQPYPYPVEVPANIDSLWQEAKLYWQNLYKDSLELLNKPVNYIAKAETTFTHKDNKNTKVSLSVDFTSPIPLHPNSYFGFNRIDLTYPEITKTVEKQRTFWDKIIPELSLQTGVGYGVFHKNLDVYLGAGLSWRLGDGN